MKKSITARILAIILLLVGGMFCLIGAGWNPADAVDAARSHDTEITWADYTEPGVVANGNMMPDGTVINPWEATKDLKGQERVDAVYAELVARTDPENSDRPSAALLAELSLDAENRESNEGHTLGITILDRNQNAPMVDRPNEAQRDFKHDDAYAIEAFTKLHAIWESAEEVWIEDLNDYDSSFYMIHDGYLIDGELNPLVVGRHSHNSGGHCICFKVRIKDTDEFVIRRYRLECGFQPINPEYFPIPDTPPVPDNPEPYTPEPDEPEPDPYLEPKDPEQGYQHRNPDNPDVGGGPNHDNDTTVTQDPDPEHTSPDTYTPPAPPTEDKPSGGGSKPDASSGTHSGSQTVDNDNGKQESGGTVQAGDGKDHGDFSQHVDSHPAPVEQHANPEPTQDNPSPGNDECDAPE